MTKPMYKIEIITRQEKFEDLMAALNAVGVTGMTVYNVSGCGAQKGAVTYYRGVATEIKLLPKVKIDIVVSEVPVEKVLEVCENVLKTGRVGDGKVFVSEVSQVLRIRTGERDWDALQD